MIRTHEFNAAWWGGPVGLVDDVTALLEAPAKEREESLAAYEWVELRMPLAEAPVARIARCGFFQADTQIRFRIACNRVPATPSLAHLSVERASLHPFVLDGAGVAPFPHERFRHLPAIEGQRLHDRYVTWANQELRAAPEWCLQLRSEGVVQGWFLAHPADGGLNLELAMLHRQASLSGMYLYQRALVEYAALGARVGQARFSIENTAVLNIYARLGAQFLPPVGIWLWTRR
jgi:hypothetical protein